ncbi:NERD domain-containing protein kinase family protein [Ammoniphilus sp. CFH 90114]|uniref:NERD domain-containing protein kinase family protein n=1 Tax=Ammoniphilus sp. CFH 90114 TaxID=2493665 RepID=UPI0013E99712|nr:NERD domain-containing protein kinase family protein [Ammoniphilus sp. CFH 90114]
MIKKRRPFPLRIKQEEALLRRLPLNHKKRQDITQSLRNLRAGYRGEVELDYHLQFLPEKDFLIFQDLRLPLQDRFFQIDTLVLTPAYALIIESKNIYGHLFFNPVSKQVIRTFQDNKEGFPDPLMQAKRQQIQLQKWMEAESIKSCPVYKLISIGSPSTIVETAPGNEAIFTQILHAEHIPNKILEFPTEPKLLSSYQLKKLSEHLLQNHIPLKLDILKRYRLSSSELLKGIACPHCPNHQLTRIFANWKCPQCKTKRKKAHVRVIKDHLLIHGFITNEQCRELLNLSSIHTATRLLKAMRLPLEGKTKGRVYYTPLTPPI